MADIFISYSREDRPHAERLARALEAHGWSVWWDVVIPAGRTFHDVISEEIEAARCVIVLWSNASVSSNWVREEADHAKNRGILVPLLIEADVTIPFGFGLIQAANLVGWDGSEKAASFQQLLGDIGALLGPPPRIGEEQRAAAEADERGKAEEKRRRQAAEEGNKSADEEERRRAKVAAKRQGVEAEKRLRAEREGKIRTRRMELAKPALWIGGIAGVIVVAVIMITRPWQDTVAEPALRPGDTDCVGCPEMVVIPADSFMMGSPDAERGRDGDEGPQHPVTIRSFAIGKYEVTRAEYSAFARATGREWDRPSFSQTERDPAVKVSWNDAKAYVAWLSQETGQEYRLPSESEWEYAARATTTTARYWGESSAKTCDYANIDDDSHRCSDGNSYTAPVGSFEPNSFGLYDMLGNVWEWVEDCWKGSYSGAPADGSASTSGDCALRVRRGNSWDGKPSDVRSANRYWLDTTERSDQVGFRVARSLP